MEERIRQIIWENKPSQSKAAKEITEHIMEFIEWIGENEFYRNKGKDGQWIFKSEPYIVWKTDEELYQYWLTNIKEE
jgi:hypothetical protein